MKLNKDTVIMPSDTPDWQQLQAALIAKVRQQAAIADLSQIALTGLDLTELLNEAVTRTAKTLDVKYCKVLEFLPDNKTLVMCAGFGWQGDWIGHDTVKAEENSQAGYTLLSSKPVVIEDWRTETRFEPSELLDSHNIVSGISVVIGGRKQPFGILGAYTTEKREFTGDEIRFLQTIANTLATAIEHHRTQETLQHREQFNRDVLNSLTASIAIINREGVITAVNKAWEDFARENGAVSLAGIGVGTNYLDICRKVADEITEAKQVLDNMQAILNGAETTFSMEYACHSPTVNRWFLMQMTPLLKGSGVAVVSHFDITDRVQIEKALQESNTILQAVIEGTPDIIFVKDLKGRYVLINSAGARIMNTPADEIIGQTDEQFFPSNLSRELMSEDRRIMNGGHGETNENIITTPNGVQIFQTTKVPYFNSEGDIIGVIGVARNITDLKHVEFSQRLLASAGELLETSLDYNVRLTKITQLIVPNMADWCSIDILDQDQNITHVAMAHTDPEKVAWAQKLQSRYPPDLNAPQGVPNVLRTGKSELYPYISDELLQAVARNAEHLGLIRNLQMKSAMMVPLNVEGKTLGAMTFVWAESNRQYTRTDLDLAEELARRVAVAVDNARLYHTEQENRQIAEQLSKRLAGLQAVTAALSQALTPRQVAQVITSKGLAQIGADSGVIVLLDKTGENLNIVHHVGYLPEEMAGRKSFPISMATPLAEAVRTNEPIFIGTVQALQERYLSFASYSKNLYKSMVVLPLTITGQKPMGAIGLSFYEAREFSREEREFMLAVAWQCAQALERARLYDAERQARTEAEKAQQSLTALAETRERNRLAQELHDNIAQAIGYLNLKIAMANMQLEQGQLDSLKESLNELKQVIGETYTDVRGEIFNLRSETTQELNFLKTLQSYIEKYKRFYNLNISMNLEADEADFDFEEPVKLQIIRTVQEALMNVRKHAGVKKAAIHLTKTDQELSIHIEDQGQGFDHQVTANKEGSYGLQIMYERMESVGGQLKIDSEPGQGTSITLLYPI